MGMIRMTKEEFKQFFDKRAVGAGWVDDANRQRMGKAVIGEPGIETDADGNETGYYRISHTTIDDDDAWMVDVNREVEKGPNRSKRILVRRMIDRVWRENSERREAAKVLSAYLRNAQLNVRQRVVEYEEEKEAQELRDALRDRLQKLKERRLER